MLKLYTPPEPVNRRFSACFAASLLVGVACAFAHYVENLMGTKNLYWFLGYIPAAVMLPVGVRNGYFSEES